MTEMLPKSFLQSNSSSKCCHGTNIALYHELKKLMAVMMNQAEMKDKFKTTRTQARYGQTMHKSERTDRTPKKGSQSIKELLEK